MTPKNFILLFFLLILFSCQETTKNKVDKKNSTNQINHTSTEKVNDHFTYKTTFSPDIGWGYQILNNDAIYINQPHMPAVEGVQGFSDESKAIKTAELMIYKLKNGIFPPTISVDELDSLGVLNK